VCPLPIRAPWLNPVEPKWAHGKRATAEPERLLSAAEVETRVCEHYGCPHEERLQQPAPATKRKKVA
jgi:hypothetical protein